MNARIIFVSLLLACANAVSDDTELSDPTAPFSHPVKVTINSPKIVSKAAVPQWNLGGVLISEDGKKALLNGRWYKEHEYVDGWQVSLIETSAVVLKRVGKTLRVAMYPTLMTNTVNLQAE